MSLVAITLFACLPIGQTATPPKANPTSKAKPPVSSTARPTGPKKLSFDEVERSKHNAYRALTDYAEVVQMQLGGGQGVVFLQAISKERCKTAIMNGEKPVVESGYDGQARWLISHPEKKYGLKLAKNLTYSMPYVPQKADPKAEPRFDMQFQDGYNIRFLSNPPFVVTDDRSDKIDGKSVRRITARASIEGTKRFVELKQWFLPNSWLLVRWEANGLDRAGKSFKAGGLVVRASLRAGLKPDNFKLDVNSVKGYKRVDN